MHQMRCLVFTHWVDMLSDPMIFDIHGVSPDLVWDSCRFFSLVSSLPFTPGGASSTLTHSVIDWGVSHLLFFSVVFMSLSSCCNVEVGALSAYSCGFDEGIVYAFWCHRILAFELACPSFRDLSIIYVRFQRLVDVGIVVPESL